METAREFEPDEEIDEIGQALDSLIVRLERARERGATETADAMGVADGLERIDAALSRSADALERSHETNLRQMSDIRAASRKLDADLEESRGAIEALVNG